jgi:hypothetical protein
VDPPPVTAANRSDAAAGSELLVDYLAADR